MPPLYQRYGMRKGDDDEQRWYPVPVPVALRQAHRGILLSALAWADGNQAKAARALAISPKVFGDMMIRYAIPRDRAPYKRKAR